MLLSKLSSLNAWKNRPSRENRKTRRRLSTCFLSNTGEVNLYMEIFKIQMYNTIKSLSAFSPQMVEIYQLK